MTNYFFIFFQNGFYGGELRKMFLRQAARPGGGSGQGSRGRGASCLAFSWRPSALDNHARLQKNCPPWQTLFTATDKSLCSTGHSPGRTNRSSRKIDQYGLSISNLKGVFVFTPARHPPVTVNPGVPGTV